MLLACKTQQIISLVAITILVGISKMSLLTGLENWQKSVQDFKAFNSSVLSVEELGPD